MCQVFRRGHCCCEAAAAASLLVQRLARGRVMDAARNGQAPSQPKTEGKGVPRWNPPTPGVEPTGPARLIALQPADWKNQDVSQFSA